MPPKSYTPDFLLFSKMPLLALCCARVQTLSLVAYPTLSYPTAAASLASSTKVSIFRHTSRYAFLIFTFPFAVVPVTRTKCPQLVLSHLYCRFFNSDDRVLIISILLFLNTGRWSRKFLAFIHVGGHDTRLVYFSYRIHFSVTIPLRRLFIFLALLVGYKGLKRRKTSRAVKPDDLLKTTKLPPRNKDSLNKEMCNIFSPL